MRNLLLPVLAPLLSLFAACGGGGGGGAAPGTPAGTAGSVHVALDTATGTGGTVQFLVGGAVLRRTDGSHTGDVLATPAVVTFTDPSGELSYVSLRNVPSGDYDALQLMLMPNTGRQLAEDGTHRSLDSALAIDIPLRENLRHDAAGSSWLVVGHEVGNTVQAAGSTFTFAPSLAGRTDGSHHAVGGLRTARRQDDRLWVLQPGTDGGVLEIEFGDDCSWSDDGSNSIGSRSEFLAGLGSDDDVRVEAEVHRDGRLVAHRAHRSSRNDNPRLLGRIQAIDAASASFTLRVQAEVRHGDHTLLAVPVDVRVLAANARLEQNDSHATLPFAALAVGNLAKVKWTSRTAVAGQLDDVVAREVEITTGAGAPLQPEWEGRVQAVDLLAGTITVQRRGDDPIVIGGVSVAQATLTIGAGTQLRRQGNGGGGDVAIPLAAIVAGQDRIWWRGTVTGPAAVAATWVRVRAQ